MGEQRAEKRVAAQLRVWCEGEDFTFLAHTLNLSPSGMFVRTSGPAPESRRFNVVIDDLGVVAEVEVSWVRTPPLPGHAGFGVRILGFERGAEAYRSFVERNTSRSGEHQLWLPPEPEASGPEAEPEPDDLDRS